MQIFKAPLKDIKHITETNKLVIHEHSAMSNLLRNNRKKKIICYVLTNKNIIGWAWLISERGKYYSFMVFIKPKFRRNGYGSLLLEYVKDDIKHNHKRIVVYPRNEKKDKSASNNFYIFNNIKEQNMKLGGY